MCPTTENLDDILKKLLAANKEVKAVAIMSVEGLPIASVIPRGVDEVRIAVMASVLFSLGKRSIIEIRKGDFDQICIKGSDGNLLVEPVGPNAVMLLSTEKGFKGFGSNMFNRLGPFKPPGSSSAAATVERDF